MGAVFEAEHPALGKRVAIKFLSPLFANAPDMASRFLAEARTAASLQHPNIVAVLDFSEFDDARTSCSSTSRGAIWRCASSSTGGSRSKNRCLSCRRSDRRSLSRTARIIHRDLKPENVFVSRRHAVG